MLLSHIERLPLFVRLSFENLLPAAVCCQYRALRQCCAIDVEDFADAKPTSASLDDTDTAGWKQTTNCHRRLPRTAIAALCNGTTTWKRKKARLCSEEQASLFIVRDKTKQASMEGEVRMRSWLRKGVEATPSSIYYFFVFVGLALRNTSQGEFKLGRQLLT